LDDESKPDPHREPDPEIQPELAPPGGWDDEPVGAPVVQPGETHPGLRDRLVAAARTLPPLALGDHLRVIGSLLRWVVLGSVVGLLAGGSSFLFLKALNWATDTRLTHGAIVWFLPLAGLAVGLLYHYLGGRAIQGNALLLDEIHEPTGGVPKRMAPLIYAASVVTQLFGGSAGREGVAIQMSGSLTELFSRTIRVNATDRRILLIAALSGGFGAMFGTPMAGAIFGLEVQAVGRIRYDALVPALTASVVGNQVVHALGWHHTATQNLGVIDLTPGLVGKLALAGVAFGLCGAAFIELTHGIRTFIKAALPWAPARPFLGGVVILALMVAAGTRQYLGLSLPLIDAALAGATMGFGVFALKMLFTSVTLGSGFQGGEVTPLFCMGATLGAALGHALGVPIPVLAAMGYVAVFAGAANTPLTCTIMGVELFGSGAVIPLAIVCVISYVFSSHRSIFPTQRVAVAKDGRPHEGGGTIAGFQRPPDS
jgi:H+/Cl- antiporter ClcA